MRNFACLSRNCQNNPVITGAYEYLCTIISEGNFGSLESLEVIGNYILGIIKTSKKS